MRFRFPPWAVALALLALFLTLNAGAYGGYFSDDDLDNLSWNSFVGIEEYARGLIDPKLSPHNFRPVGHFFFWSMERLAGDSFPAYVAVIQAIHVFNAALIFWLARRLSGKSWSALAAASFFAFHLALFDAVWKPMYIFDTVCATFCLLTVAAWLSRRWLMAVALFWLAYKAKEVAIFLPAALALYEFTRGERRWKPLIPLFAISVSFGLQALLTPKGPVTDYSLRFTRHALQATVPFYARTMGMVSALVLVLASRGPWLAGGAILLLPLLFLPGRLFSVYWYVPLALIVLSLAPRLTSRGALAALILWGGWTGWHHRERRRAELERAGAARLFYTQLAVIARSHPRLKTLYYDGVPPGTNAWGVEGIVHWQSRNPTMEVRYSEQPPPLSRDAALAHWDATNGILSLRRGNDPL